MSSRQNSPSSAPPCGAEIIRQFEEYSKGVIRKNIFQNMSAIFNLHYDLVDMMKLYKKKQIGFQSLTLLLDVCFYHDLTVLIALEEENLLIQQEVLRQQKLREIGTRSDQKTSDATQPKQPIFLDKLQAHMRSQLSSFLRFIRDQREVINCVSKQQSLIQQKLILQILNQIEVLNSFVKLQVNGALALNSFAFLALPKFSIEVASRKFKEKSSFGFPSPEDVTEPSTGSSSVIARTIRETKNAMSGGGGGGEDDRKIPKIAAKSEFLTTILDSATATISLIALNFKVSYGYEM